MTRNIQLCLLNRLGLTKETKKEKKEKQKQNSDEKYSAVFSE